MNTTAENEASTFIALAKARELADDTVGALLRNAGWSERRAVRLW